MTYLDEDARLIRSLLPGEASPPQDTDLLFVLYAVLLRAKGTNTSLEDVHNAWSAWMIAKGQDHKSLVPFDALGSQVQGEDQPYLEAIHKASWIKAGAGSDRSSS